MTIEFPMDKFEDWLAGQPGERRFDYQSNEDCLFASFAKEAMKWPYAVAGSVDIDNSIGERMGIPFELAGVANCMPDSFTVAMFRKSLQPT